jgi:hypothetical protein
MQKRGDDQQRSGRKRRVLERVVALRRIVPVPPSERRTIDHHERELADLRRKDA